MYSFGKNCKFCTNTIVDEIRSQGQCTKDVQLFSLVVHLFKNIHMRTTEFVQLWEKLYIFVQTPLSMKLGAKDNVPKMYSFFLWLYCFLLVVQLFKNIHMRTTEFVQHWKKTVHISTNIIVNEIRSQGQCTKNVQLFSLAVQLFNGCTAFYWLYSFSKIYI